MASNDIKSEDGVTKVRHMRMVVGGLIDRRPGWLRIDVVVHLHRLGRRSPNKSDIMMCPN